MSHSREGYLWTPEGDTEGLRTEAVLSSTATRALLPSYDVVVIGAGFAGLVAARDICQSTQMKVLVVEGGDRIGGRTWTASALGEEFEMGGTWVDTLEPTPHVPQLHRYGLHRNLKTSAGTFAPEKTYYKRPGAPVIAIDGGESTATIDRVASAFFELDGHTSRTLIPYPHDPMRQPRPWARYDHLGVRQRLDQMHHIPQKDRDLFESMVNSLGSAPGRDIGFVELLRWYALGGHSMTQMFDMTAVYKIGKGGMMSLARAIQSDFTGHIVFDTVVRELRQTHSGVELVSATGQHRFHAKAVISTIPLNCLSDITFDPPLGSPRQHAVRQGHINKGAKIHFQTQEIEAGWSGTCDAYADASFNCAFSDHNGTKAFGPDGTYCVGFGFNDHLQNKKDSTHIVREINWCFRPGTKVTAYLTHDWTHDPFSKGTWSCWGPGSMGRYLEVLQQPHGRVVFASADWADGWRGFVDGAIESGTRAARDVMKSEISSVARL